MHIMYYIIITETIFRVSSYLICYHFSILLNQTFFSACKNMTNLLITFRLKLPLFRLNPNRSVYRIHSQAFKTYPHSIY